MSDQRAYHSAVSIDLSGAVRIAWDAEGLQSVHVIARWRTRTELERYAQAVADAALLNRTLADLRTALRRLFPGAFDLEVIRHDERDPRVVVRFHPPRGEPNPDV